MTCKEVGPELNLGPWASLKVLKKIFVDLVCQQCNIMSIFFGSARVSGLYYIIRNLLTNVLFFVTFTFDLIKNDSK